MKRAQNLIATIKELNKGKDSYYIYVFNPINKTYIYERTTSTKDAAESRIRELEIMSRQAIYLVNHTINGAFY